MSASESERMTCPRCGGRVAVLMDARLYCAVCGYQVTLAQAEDADKKSEPPTIPAQDSAQG